MLILVAPVDKCTISTCCEDPDLNSLYICYEMMKGRHPSAAMWEWQLLKIKIKTASFLRLGETSNHPQQSTNLDKSESDRH